MFRKPLRPELKSAEDHIQRRIAVAGCSRGCGVSFVSGCLAAYLRGSSDVTLAELGTPYFYYALGIERRFADREFVFYEDSALRCRSPRTLRNREMGLNLMLKNPLQDRGYCRAGGPDLGNKSFCMSGSEADLRNKGFGTPGRADLPAPAPDFAGDTVIADCSGMEEGDLISRVFPWADSVILVADPLPSALLSGAGRLKRLRLARPDALISVNFMNRGVHRGELIRFLSSEKIAEIPLIPPELIYASEYGCILPYDDKNVKKLMESPASAVLRQLHGSDL